jgi:hypothetical protein
VLAIEKLVTLFETGQVCHSLRQFSRSWHLHMLLEYAAEVKPGFSGGSEALTLGRELRIESRH